MEKDNTTATCDIINGLSIDVEDFFQVSNFDGIIPFENWDTHELRVEQNTVRILDLLDKHKIKATFFVLGWIAEKVPALIQEIAVRGHEVASHGYRHRLVYDMSPEEFRDDILKSKSILEALSGKPVIGFRAPSYSVTKKSFWALSILRECGFLYDSSIFPIHHHRYGIPEFYRFPTTITLSESIRIEEYPISTIKIFGKNFPVGGGAYFRLFPFAFSNWGLKTINDIEQKPFIFYFHPWEIDYGQPRIPCSITTKIRHYGNLGKMEGKLDKLFSKFKFAPIKDI